MITGRSRLNISDTAFAPTRALPSATGIPSITLATSWRPPPAAATKIIDGPALNVPKASVRASGAAYVGSTVGNGKVCPVGGVLGSVSVVGGAVVAEVSGVDGSGCSCW